jgi:hypothetical protein
MQSDQPDSAEKRIADIFGQVVKEMMNPQQGTQASDLSELYIQQRIDNAFAIEVTMTMLSNQIGQSFEFRTYHDQYRNSGYVVKFLQENEQSLALIRFDPSGSSVIDMTRQGRMFRQNAPQSISWMRNADGEMKVMIGKEAVLNTKDNMFKAFDGISFINEGGGLCCRQCPCFGCSQINTDSHWLYRQKFLMTMIRMKGFSLKRISRADFFVPEIIPLPRSNDMGDGITAEVKTKKPAFIHQK